MAFLSQLIFFGILLISEVVNVNGDSQTLVESKASFMEQNARYVGHCNTKTNFMWPGNSRKFWSYGYMHLKQDYFANCSMTYTYDTRSNPLDPMRKYSFRVTGVFYGLADGATDCTTTDHIFLDDTIGTQEYYCGPHVTIDWYTTNDYFVFNFETLENSPGARGFHVVIQSVELCGGSFKYGEVPPMGQFKSPGYPANYPNDIGCAYYFYTPASLESSVTIKCEHFELEEPLGNGTCIDYLSFTYEIPNSKSVQYCGTSLDEGKSCVWSLTNDLVVYFYSDSSTNAPGLNCSYEFIVFAD